MIDQQLKKALEENKKLREESKKKDEVISSLNNRVDLLEQRTRINNVEVCNFPVTPGENLVDIVKEIGNKVGLKIEDGNIQAAHRVPCFNKAATKNIIIQFCSRWKKNMLLQACSNYRKANNNKISANTINCNLPDQTLYISEHLTPKYKGLLKKTKQRAKEVGWKYIWTNDCYIYAKKDEANNRRISVACEGDIDEIK